MRKQTGFTLAELLAVMAILMILASMAIPTGSRQLRAARNQQYETTLTIAMDNALLAALKQSRDPAAGSEFSVQMPDEVLQALKELTKWADVKISCGEKVIKIDKSSISENVDTVKYNFKEISGVLTFDSVEVFSSGISCGTFS